MCTLLKLATDNRLKTDHGLKSLRPPTVFHECCSYSVKTVTNNTVEDFSTFLATGYIAIKKKEVANRFPAELQTDSDYMSSTQ